ncbi:gamma-glutamyl-gamma-aminobutyrate hydrolase family protein [Rapidithrix thailandica]|uniref:CTP synthase (glutamine hydrolyzing) n=1 Tax=Rapidithrix thailandica TaxID=413964 RepID=A0AAW9S5X2_9BACT
MRYHIAILGDHNPNHSTHQALDDSIKQVVKLFEEDLRFDWVSTDTFEAKSAFNHQYAGLWIAPGSPYKNTHNVLDAIRYAREHNIPVFGNCGGFQHMLLEFARNVCGIANADHEEINPDASDLLISKLNCSLVEQEEELTLVNTNSILFDTIRKEKLTGRYYCNYGLNCQYQATLKTQGLKITALSDDGQVRAFEVEQHPFFLGTLFQPALTSTYEEPNPLIYAFVRKVIQNSRH